MTIDENFSVFIGEKIAFEILNALRGEHIKPTLENWTSNTKLFLIRSLSIKSWIIIIFETLHYNNSFLFNLISNSIIILLFIKLTNNIEIEYKNMMIYREFPKESS